MCIYPYQVEPMQNIDWVANSCLTNFDVLSSDMEYLFTDEFRISLRDTIGRMYTISELLEILNSYEVGKESEWISRIDEHLEKIEILEEFEKYIVQMENLREFIRTCICTLLIAPTGVLLIRATFAYMLIILQYGGIERLSDFSEREKIERDTGERDFFLLVCRRAFATMSYLSMKTFACQLDQILTGLSIKPLEWSSDESSNLGIYGRPVLDCGVWRDFNEHLSEVEGLFTHTQTQPCAVM